MSMGQDTLEDVARTEEALAREADERDEAKSEYDYQREVWNRNAAEEPPSERQGLQGA